MENNMLLDLIAILISGFLGYLLCVYITQLKATAALKHANTILKDAKKEAENLQREALLNAKSESVKMRDKFEQEVKDQKFRFSEIEERFIQREQNLERKVNLIDKKENSIETKLAQIDIQKEDVELQKEGVTEVINQQKVKLQEISSLTEEAAKKQLLNTLEEDIKKESGALIKQFQDDAHEKAEREARKIITLAIERYAADQVNNITTTSVHLPNDEMKGRIIGKEGRNIKSLEAETGVNILIDDTPETVVISGFDPVRREVARLTLEALMDDGRIHPGRIEEVVAKVKADLENVMQEAGEQAIMNLGLRSLAPEIVRTIGRLKYRHSFSQNVLKHSIEMAHLMGNMASELQLDAMVAKRIGLLHDIGKALDHDIEGSHAVIGADLLRKYNEDPVVINAVEAHHGDVEKESLYATLTVAADAITAARPGARSETTEVYLKRLSDLEEIANSFKGVLNCYAIQAGRELRVIVEPNNINDDEVMLLARNISKEIETKMKYPGQIKVTVVRETRSIDYAR